MEQTQHHWSIIGSVLLGLLSCAASAVEIKQVVAPLFEDSHDIQLIDCRDSNYYNGWQDKQETVSGHVQGAINYSVAWLDKDGGLDELKTIVSRFNKSSPTYLYCPNDDAQLMAHKFVTWGFTDVRVAKALHPQQALQAYEHYDKLVPSWWLQDLLAGKDVENPPTKDYQVVEVAWGMPKQYLLAHIPGAIYLDTNEIEAEPLWNLHPFKKLKETAKNHGFSKDATVILYGRDNMAAARAAAVLMYMGIDDVRLLNGGWSAWEGKETEALFNSPKPATVELSEPTHPEYVTSIDRAKELLADQQGSSLVSIRTWPEFIGHTSGYSYIEPKGRIKGAKWGQSGEDSHSLAAFRNIDGTMLAPEIVEDRWQRWGINRSQNVAFYCGTGWRASEVFFYTYVAGWKNISVFDGGWYEWSSDVNNPTEIGEPSS